MNESAGAGKFKAVVNVVKGDKYHFPGKTGR